MQQTLNLTVGTKYILSFGYKSKAAGGSRTLYIGVDTQVLLTLPLSTVSSIRTALFTASAKNQVLYFSAQGDTAGSSNCKLPLL